MRVSLAGELPVSDLIKNNEIEGKIPEGRDDLRRKEKEGE